MKYLVAFLLLSWSTAGFTAELAPFTSDGCSSFPNGTPQNQNLWLNCCIRHDFAYWKGGTEQQRLEADLALEQCVAKAGEPTIASLMLQGVRAGGTPSLPTPYRWGYGWPFGRGYQALTTEELTQVKMQLQALQATINEVAETLNNE
jgi:hypothetical protein